MASMTLVVSKFMHVNELVFDVSFVVTPTVSKCAYNQWNLNTFAYCGLNFVKMNLDATVKIYGSFEAVIVKSCFIGSA